MSDIEQLTKKILEFRDARNWKQFHNPKDLAISLTLEAAEVLELFQWKTKEEMDAYVTMHKEDIAEELVDTLYWVLLLAHDLDIDLKDSFDKKMAKNNAKYPIDKAKDSHKKYTQL